MFGTNFFGFGNKNQNESSKKDADVNGEEGEAKEYKRSGMGKGLVTGVGMFTALAAGAEGIPKGVENIPAANVITVNEPSKTEAQKIEERQVFMEAQREMQLKQLKQLQEKQAEVQQKYEDEKSILDDANSQKEALFGDFAKYYANTLTHLSKKDAKDFAKVESMPHVFEKLVRAMANAPEHVKSDCTSPAAIEYFKSFLINYDNKDVGEMVRILQTVINEQNIASPLGAQSNDMDAHQFFGGIHVRIIKNVAFIIMEERKVKVLDNEVAEVTSQVNTLTATLGAESSGNSTASTQ